MLKPFAKQALRFWFTTFASVALSAVGYASTTVGSSFGFNPGDYNYTPSVTQIGQTQYFFWCAGGYNPNDPTQYSDTIQFWSHDLTTGATVGPEIVLAETPGAWDSAYTCNPQFVTGNFTNPLGNGTNYSYALYYVATGETNVNDIGVAFSNDFVHWAKFPNPVITHHAGDTGYGVAQPAAYNYNGGSGIQILYEDSYPSANTHIQATSTDGIHFTTLGTITTNGLNQVGITGQSSYSPPAWGNAAFDSSAGYWYAVYNMNLRPLADTGEVLERGQPGVVVYKIPSSSLLTGATAWSQVFSVDASLTGYESNFIPSFLRDKWGNVNVSGSYPKIEIYASSSVPQPSWNDTPAERGSSAGTAHWDIVPEVWAPGSPLIPFQRYYNGEVHEVTTGWVDPSGGWTLEGTEGYLYESPESGATAAVYGCVNSNNDYFASNSSDCEGNDSSFLGIDGYLFPSPGTGLEALYRCYTGHDHFVSTQSTCEGSMEEYILGYAKISQ
jgi:hypothetical protein